MTRESEPRTVAGTVRQTIVETLEAPRLTGITTADFVQFKQRREVYERRVSEKNSQEGFDVPLTSYSSSVEEPILALMIRASWIKAESVNSITEEQLKMCVYERSRIDPSEYDLAQIEKGIADVRLGTAKKNLEMKVWELDLQYSTVLKNLGYSEFIQEQSELAVKHIMKRVAHPALKRRIQLTYQLRKKELKEDYGKFMRELAKEARGIDRQEAASSYGDNTTASGSEAEEPLRGMAKERKRRRKEKSRTGQGSKDKDKSRKARKVECLNPRCKEEHLVRKCPKTSKEKADRLLKESYDNKKEQKKGKPKVQLGSLGGELESSAMLPASFCQGAVEAVAKADQGSDCNLIPPSMLQNLKKSNPRIKEEKLVKPQPYGTVIKDGPKVYCTHKVVSNIMLYVRHGTTLMLRGVEWMVSDCETEFVILGEPTLKALGLDNRALLEASCDKYGGTVDVPELLGKLASEDNPQNRTTGDIQSLMSAAKAQWGSTFHQDGGAEEDALEDSDVYVDLGDDPIEDLEAMLEQRVEEARAAGISEKGSKRLTTLLKKYQ